MVLILENRKLFDDCIFDIWRVYGVRNMFVRALLMSKMCPALNDQIWLLDFGEMN